MLVGSAGCGYSPYGGYPRRCGSARATGRRRGIPVMGSRGRPQGPRPPPHFRRGSPQWTAAASSQAKVSTALAALRPSVRARPAQVMSSGAGKDPRALDAFAPSVEPMALDVGDVDASSVRTSNVSQPSVPATPRRLPRLRLALSASMPGIRCRYSSPSDASTAWARAAVGTVSVRPEPLERGLSCVVVAGDGDGDLVWVHGWFLSGGGGVTGT